MDHPAPTTTASAPEVPDAVTIVGGGGTEVDFSPPPGVPDVSARAVEVEAPLEASASKGSES